MTADAMSTLDPRTVELRGERLVEASAGTGKTYAIAALYLRLVIDGVATVDRILVVTYTVSATQELRDRIRMRLRDARAAFRGGTTEDDLLADLVANHADPAAALRRLDAALLGFDEAAVFTIHGFCQRVLADRAFEAGLPFDFEMDAGEDPVLSEIAADHWRNTLRDAPPGYAGYLLDAGWTPDGCLREVARYRARGNVERRVPEPIPPPEFVRILDVHADLARQVRTMWMARRGEIVEMLRTDPGLDRNKYRLPSVVAMAETLDRFLVPGTPRIRPRNKDAATRLAKFRASAIAAAVKKKHEPLRDAFFDRFEDMWNARQDAEDACRARTGSMLDDLLRRCVEDAPNRKRALRVRSFDDLLIDLRDAIERDGPDGGTARAIRDRYRAALIDEFQDTDSLQYDIFRSVYRGTDAPVFTVGDPKQAIYSFRGADVFAYLDARRETTERSTLDTNWRADPGLVRAVNTMFGTAPLPFAIPGLDYRSVGAGVKTPLPPVVDGEPLPPVRIWRTPKGAAGDAESRVAEALAGEIRRLLAGPTAIPGRDIAILVRTNKQARRVRDTLHRHGVACVMLSGESVFTSHEAAELEIVLRAISAPGRESWARAALTTEMIGMTGDAIAAADVDSTAWDEALDRLRRFRELWLRRGVVGMLRELLEEYRVAHRLLQLPDGERRLTNLQHLVELLQTGPGRDAGPEDVVRWLGERCRGAEDGTELTEETRQLRLESDENLVRIVTVHRAKGLEYGVVFCPFPWWGGVPSGATPSVRTYHEEGEAAHRAILDFRPDPPEEALRSARIEDLSEDLRLLYVALTRARHHLTIAWGPIQRTARSAIAWLLHAGEAAGPDLAFEGVGKLDDARVDADLNEVANASDGTIVIGPLPDGGDPDGIDAGPARPEVAARPPAIVPPPRWRGTSFSSLTRGTHEEQADRDAGTGPPAYRPAAGEVGHLLGFPGGTRAGSCLHAVLERAHLDNPDHPDHEVLIHRALRDHGYGDALAPAVHAMLRAVAKTPLDPAGTLRLGDVPETDRIPEMEFLYPVTRLHHDGLGRILERHRVSCDPVRFDTVDGFLRGFIDLVFTHDGRWYVLDWKSNWLGSEIEDYAADRLPAVMARDRYVLQALLYVVALHRYLERALEGYDYDRHVGGAYYLFLRGLDPARGSATGVHHEAPARALIEDLDAHLRGDAT